MFRVVLEIDGKLEGYALYRMHASWDQNGRRASYLDAIEVLGTSPAATREIWSFVFGVDLATQVSSRHRGPDDALLLTLLDPREIQLRVADGLWVRVVDLEAALNARAYGTTDALTFELTDPFCPWNAGVWTLEAGPTGAQLRRATTPPDLRLTAAELSALYLGGVACTSLWRAGRVDELTPKAAHRADLLFRSDVPPWCLDDF
jgi:predicted acetyltransferase